MVLKYSSSTSTMQYHLQSKHPQANESARQTPHHVDMLLFKK